MCGLAEVHIKENLGDPNLVQNIRSHEAFRLLEHNPPIDGKRHERKWKKIYRG
jgi:hypothetical protein